MLPSSWSPLTGDEICVPFTPKRVTWEMFCLARSSLMSFGSLLLELPAVHISSLLHTTLLCPCCRSFCYQLRGIFSLEFSDWRISTLKRSLERPISGAHLSCFQNRATLAQRMRNLLKDVFLHKADNNKVAYSVIRSQLPTDTVRILFQHGFALTRGRPPPVQIWQRWVVLQWWKHACL